MVGCLLACAGCAGPRAGVGVSDVATVGRAPIYGPADSPVDTYWKLLELNGKPAPHGSGGKEAHLLLQPDQPIARGFGGCNRFSARYELDGEKLRFRELVSTKRACAEGLDLESDYLAALGRVASWSRSGERLTLFDADGQPVARFMLRPL